MITIKLPKYFIDQELNFLLDQLENLVKEVKNNPQEITFDLIETKYVSVLGILLIVQSCDDFWKIGCKCFIRHITESTPSWFVRIMWPKNETTNEIHEYLDTIRVRVQRCFDSDQSQIAVDKFIPIIKAEFKPSDHVLKALNWALWEFVGNAGMHGYGFYGEVKAVYPKPVYFCAFDYKNIIEIATLDVGRGIHKSFVMSGKEKYKNITNEEALKLSIQDEESGHPAGSPGFGLYGCAEIARQSNGKLIIISGNNKLIVTKDKTEIFPSSNFNGTMVSLTIAREGVINLENIFGKENVMVVESIDDLLERLNGKN
ncbi:MAG: hypothetical protein NTX01_04370 [Candidatus Omnitrophica bacterium]|nr:hypothetical protein [Candidatus Omnitrophota bacterium]